MSALGHKRTFRSAIAMSALPPKAEVQLGMSASLIGRSGSSARVRQHWQQCLGFTCHFYFPHDPACIIHNADARRLDRNVQSSKMLHAALLLLMLEAVHTDLVSPSA